MVSSITQLKMKKVDLLREINVEGLKLTADQKAEFIASYEEAIKKAVNDGETVRTGLGIYKKKHKKSRRISAKTITVKGRTIVINEGMSREKDILSFKTKVEF